MGLEYRGTITNTVPTPAIDLICDDTYWATAQPNDGVKLNASGQVVASTATDKVLAGVVAAKEFIREKGDKKIIKVRLDKNAKYEVPIAAGTPVPFTAYELTADWKLDASKTTNASVKVLEVRNGTAIVQLL